MSRLPVKQCRLWDRPPPLELRRWRPMAGPPPVRATEQVRFLSSAPSPGRRGERRSLPPTSRILIARCSGFHPEFSGGGTRTRHKFFHALRASLVIQRPSEERQNEVRFLGSALSGRSLIGKALRLGRRDCRIVPDRPDRRVPSVVVCTADCGSASPSSILGVPSTLPPADPVHGFLNRVTKARPLPGAPTTCKVFHESF